MDVVVFLVVLAVYGFILGTLARFAVPGPDPMRAARAQQAARNYDWSNVGTTILAIYRAAISAAPARRTGGGVG